MTGPTTGPNEHDRDGAGATVLEETLRRTLERAADRAPALPAAVAARLAGPPPRRAPRAQALLAAAAVVVVAAGVSVAVTAGLGGPAEPRPAGPAATASAGVSTSEPTAGPTGEPTGELTGLQAPPPIEEVWPQAVHKLPATGGERLRPIQFLDDRTLLVSTWSSFEKTNALYAYDLGTRERREITKVPTPKGTVLFASDFRTGGDRVVWWNRLKDGATQIWSAPLSGGEAALVTTVRTDESGLDGVQIAGDRVVFSARSGGVHAAPLAGGPATPVEGGASMHVLEWPWIGEPGPYGQPVGPRFGRIRNVETGETRTVTTRAGDELLGCSITHCVGHRKGAMFLRLRDGSGEQPLPGSMGRMDRLAQDRFHVATLRDRTGFVAVALYDLAGGRSADLGIEAEQRENGFSVQSPGFDSAGRLLSYEVGDTLYVVDVTKI
ncbi:TolB family protein [Nonomuraea sp. NPDC003214]